MNNLLNRIARALRLDPGLYEEVERDRNAMGQAMLVVVLSAVAAGIGMYSDSSLLGLIGDIIIALIGWFLWAYIAFFIGTQVLPEPTTRADHAELLRTTGFASSPGIIRILGVIPGICILVSIVANIWMILAMVVAVRQALDYRSTGRAVLVCIIGWLVYGLVNVLIYFITFGTLSL